MLITFIEVVEAVEAVEAVVVPFWSGSSSSGRSAWLPLCRWSPLLFAPLLSFSRPPLRPPFTFVGLTLTALLEESHLTAGVLRLIVLKVISSSSLMEDVSSEPSEAELSGLEPGEIPLTSTTLPWNECNLKSISLSRWNYFFTIDPTDDDEGEVPRWPKAEFEPVEAGGEVAVIEVELLDSLRWLLNFEAAAPLRMTLVGTDSGSV